jgi:hypothetical protein
MIKSRRLRWVGHVAWMGKRRGAFRVVVGTPEGKRSLGSPRHRWEGNTEMGLQEKVWKGLDCIDVAQD